MTSQSHILALAMRMFHARPSGDVQRRDIQLSAVILNKFEFACRRASEKGGIYPAFVLDSFLQVDIDWLEHYDIVCGSDILHGVHCSHWGQES